MRPVDVDDESAAITRPSCVRIGAEAAIRPISRSSETSDQPCSRTRARWAFDPELALLMPGTASRSSA